MKHLVTLIGGNSTLGKFVRNKFIINKIDTITTYNNNPISDKKHIEIKLNLNNVDQTISKFYDYWKNKYNILIFFSAYKKNSLIANLSHDEYLTTLLVNTLGPHQIVQKILPIMLNNNFGRFIFISSTKAKQGDIGTSAYSASKSAITSYSRCLGLEYGRFGITSNVISLGYFESKLWQDIAQSKRQELLNNVATKELCNPLDIFLVIESIINSKSINGTTINIDGGIF